jgi:hypothetical protein
LIQRGRLAAIWDGARNWVGESELDALDEPPATERLTIEEVQDLSGASVCTIWRAELPRIRILGRVYYEREPALAWASAWAAHNPVRRRRGRAGVHGAGR